MYDFRFISNRQTITKLFDQFYISLVKRAVNLLELGQASPDKNSYQGVDQRQTYNSKESCRKLSSAVMLCV